MQECEREGLPSSLLRIFLKKYTLLFPDLRIMYVCMYVVQKLHSAKKQSFANLRCASYMFRPCMAILRTSATREYNTDRL
jgi:hypothetical protein